MTWALCSNQQIREGETDAAASTERVSSRENVSREGGGGGGADDEKRKSK